MQKVKIPSALGIMELRIGDSMPILGILRSLKHRLGILGILKLLGALTLKVEVLRRLLETLSLMW